MGIGILLMVVGIVLGFIGWPMFAGRNSGGSDIGAGFAAMFGLIGGVLLLCSSACLISAVVTIFRALS